MNVTAIRAQIPVTEKSAYLNTGYSGPSPRSVVEAITQMARVEMEEGPTSPHVMDLIRTARAEARGSFARLLSADNDEVALTDNTTRGINIVLNGLRWSEGDEVVTSTTEHFGGLIPLYELRRRTGIVVRFVHLDPAWPEGRILEAIEGAITPRTRLLLLSHIMFTTGLLLPVAGIQEIARRRGISTLFDAAQCPGHIALDVHGWGCDYYAVPGHKWVLGPAGTGALYVRRDLIPDLQAVHISGTSTWRFDSDGRYEPPDAAIEKFEVSTGSAALHVGVTAAADFILSAGPREIQERWTRLTELLRLGLQQVPGVVLTGPPAGPTACGLVTFRIEGREPAAVVDELWKRGRVIVRSVVNPPAVRVSVDFFNTEEEIDRAVETLKGLTR